MDVWSSSSLAGFANDVEKCLVCRSLAVAFLWGVPGTVASSPASLSSHHLLEDAWQTSVEHTAFSGIKMSGIVSSCNPAALHGL